MSLIKNDTEQWEETISATNKFLHDILFKIEWNYGDCRAPFLFPPRYSIVRKNNRCEYICILVLEFGIYETLVFKAGSPAELVDLVKEDISKRFPFVE